MIDNELIEERLKKKARRRRIMVIIEIIIILLLFAGILYYLLAVRPAIQAGHPERAVPSFLRDVIHVPEGNGAAPEPTRLPTPTPSPEATPTPTPTPTPEPTPTLAPEIEALYLPGFDTCDPDDWELILVNQDHPIPEDYTFTLDYTDEQELYSADERIIEPLQQMLEACRDAGYTPEICSAFRSADTQTYLYQEEETDGPIGGYWDIETGEWVPTGEGYWNELGEWILTGGGYWDPDTGEWIDLFAEEDAETAPEEDADGEDTPEEEDSEPHADAVAAPGTSEHELGLAVDIYSSENIELDESQEDTETQQWLMEHCYEYGFILRYPKDKSEITGIIYEPWHYRYVGVDAAMDIRDSGLCLEEYLEQMKTYKEAEAALEKEKEAALN